MARKQRSEPPLEYRFVFVQFVRRQRTRYNPSFSRFQELPRVIQNDVIDRWHKAHPRMNLPELELSDRPKKARSK